jgi:hypothetical protein
MPLRDASCPVVVAGLSASAAVMHPPTTHSALVRLISKEVTPGSALWTRSASHGKRPNPLCCSLSREAPADELAELGDEVWPPPAHRQLRRLYASAGEERLELRLLAERIKV